MNHKVDRVNKTEFRNVVDVWEASVSVTLGFLKEEEIRKRNGLSPKNLKL